MLNLSMHDETDWDDVLEHYLEAFKPTHVGLPFHWQETAEGALTLAKRVKSNREDIKTICGGFTAGYFGESLVRGHPSIDYVIKGDPERPLELLLCGEDPANIPNLVYQAETGIRVNDVTYHVDEETISRVSFSTLAYLFDHDRYIKAVNEKLGFPLFIGRGCVFDCRYCGGSRTAFQRHSARGKPTTRSIPSIIADLHRLKEFTRKIYICYEIDRRFVKALFREMKREKELIKTFRLNYGAWHLFDHEFLSLYNELFVTDQREKPLFELSPEIFDDRARERIKGHKTYSIQELKENMRLIANTLDVPVKVYIFFSRYHDGAQTYPAVLEEIYRIFRLKYEFLVERLTNVRVYYDHLSTDVGSDYWERYVDEPRDFETLTSWTKKLKKRDALGFPADNLCIFRPKTLSEQDVLRCEWLVFMLKRLETFSPELFYILFQCLDGLAIDLLEKVIQEGYLKGPGHMSDPMDQCQLIRDLEKTVNRDSSLFSKVPFIHDLAGFQIKKFESWQTPRETRQHGLTGTPKLNHRFISIIDHDYADLRTFLERCEKEGPEGLRAQKTVFLFLKDEILSMPYETYGLTLQVFESATSLDEYYELMGERGIFDRAYHEQFVARLFESNVLY
jgi:hypothetical protein